MADKAFAPIPQDKIGESFVWRDWFQKLSNRVFGSMGNQDSNAVFITGGTIDNTPIGSNTPSTGAFTTLKVDTLAGYIKGTAGNLSAVSTIPWSDISSMPKIEAYDLSASIALTSTPTLLKPASTASGASGITYDSSTGEFTFAYAGTYALAIGVNARSSAANQFVYIYAQNNTGSGWVDNVNSGKAYELTNANTVQIVYAQAVARVAGQKVRYYIYSNSNKVDLTTFSLPSTSTVYVPAIRIQYAG